VVAGAAANGLAYLPVKQGNAFELHRLQHFTSPAPEPTVSLVVDVCGTSLVDATTYMEDAFESVAFAAAAAPALDVSLVAEGPPLKKRFGFLNQNQKTGDQKDPEQVWRETHELFHGKLELIEELALFMQLEQPAAVKAKVAKEAEGFTCRGCNVPYTDATNSGAKTKKNCGFCSKTS
jgi:hypothetical protein